MSRPRMGCSKLADQENAGLIVVGSTHTGRAGRVLPGSTAERLLHGSPCPVAVAPKDYAERPREELTVIGCGDRRLTVSRTRARHRAPPRGGDRGATAGDSRLPPLAFDTPLDGVVRGGLASYNDTLHERAAREFESAIAKIDAEPGIEAELTVGDPGHILAEASEQLDLLVVGSRGYGPMHAVMVGGVAGRLVREAACPMIVVPRGAHHTEARLAVREARRRTRIVQLR